MGQAKQRGTFDQRRTEAIQREEERLERRRQELAAQKERQRLHDLAHPKQAVAHRTETRRTAMLLAAVAGMTAIGLAHAAPAHKKGQNNE